MSRWNRPEAAWLTRSATRREHGSLPHPPLRARQRRSAKPACSSVALPETSGRAGTDPSAVVTAPTAERVTGASASSSPAAGRRPGP